MEMKGWSVPTCSQDVPWVKSREMNCEAVVKTSMIITKWEKNNRGKYILEDKSYITLQLNRVEIANPQRYLDIQLFENN